MIILRYLTRQVTLIALSITFILLVIVVAGRMLRYLARAARGELDTSVLLLLTGYRLPEFIQLTIPLALMLGVLIAYGRMYAENEMTVLTACGLSRLRLLLITLIPTTIFAAIVAFLAFFVTPWGLMKADHLLETQEQLTEFDIVVPGIFQRLSGGERTTYTETVERELMQHVFMHESASDRVTFSATAVARESETGQRYILLERGSMLEGQPGSSVYNITRFNELGVRLPARELSLSLAVDEEALPTRALLAGSEPAHQAELQWRISLVLLFPILILLIIPLSRVSPREGRFARLVPAVMLYILYFGLLLAGRDMLASGSISPRIGLWWVHGLFLLLALLMFNGRLPLLARWRG